MTNEQKMCDTATAQMVEWWDVYEGQVGDFASLWLDGLVRAQEQAQRLLNAWMDSARQTSSMLAQVLEANVKQASQMATQELEELGRLLDLEAENERAKRLRTQADYQKARLAALE